MPNVISPRDLVIRPDIMDETVKSSSLVYTVFTVHTFWVTVIKTLSVN